MLTIVNHDDAVRSAICGRKMIRLHGSLLVAMAEAGAAPVPENGSPSIDIGGCVLSYRNIFTLATIAKRMAKSISDANGDVCSLTTSEAVDEAMKDRTFVIDFLDTVDFIWRTDPLCQDADRLNRLGHFLNSVERTLCAGCTDWMNECTRRQVACCPYKENLPVTTEGKAALALVRFEGALAMYEGLGLIPEGAHSVRPEEGLPDNPHLDVKAVRALLDHYCRGAASAIRSTKNGNSKE